MPPSIDPKYTTEAIVVRPGAYVHEDALHYLAAVALPDGNTMLVPTQGKLVRLGPGRRVGIVWAYLRYHRKPFLICHDRGVTNRDLIYNIGSDDIPPNHLARSMELAMTTVVFDRRHHRVDEDFSTPGEPSNAAIKA